MAARRPGAAEPAHRPDVRPAVLRRKGKSRDRTPAQHHAGYGGGDPVAHARPVAAGLSHVRGRRSMTPEMNPMDPALERAVAEICGEPVDPAVLEAAAARSEEHT